MREALELTMQLDSHGRAVSLQTLADALAYRQACRKRFGDVPRETPPGLRWSRRGGWTYESRHHGLSLADAQARQRLAMAKVRQEEATSDIRAVESLAANASSMAWKWCQQFAASGQRPRADATSDELVGYRLARAGYKGRPRGRPV